MQAGPVTIVRWARHGQSEANVSQTLSHRVYDPDLTGLGHRQAAALADRLADGALPVAAVACSPMRRARQTADAVAARLGVPLTEVEDLRELDVGSLDGRADDAAWRIYHEVLAAWSAGALDARFPGGESGTELVARVRRGFGAAVALGDGGSPLVVAHGGNLQSALPVLTGEVPPADGLPPTGMATFDVCDDGRIVLQDWPVS